jgi:hypothetical protein
LLAGCLSRGDHSNFFAHHLCCCHHHHRCPCRPFPSSDPLPLSIGTLSVRQTTTTMTLANNPSTLLSSSPHMGCCRLSKSIQTTNYHRHHRQNAKRG